MSAFRIRVALAAGIGGLALGAVVLSCCVPEWEARGILEPWRPPPIPEPSTPHESFTFQGAGVRLAGWRFPARGSRRGLVVYLHGFGDDRRGGTGIAERFTPLGFDVIAYDSRAHGASGGKSCTYGVLEKRDLSLLLDGEPDGPVALIGGSLGAAVALQCAAGDRRISLVVAIAPYADLRTVMNDRAPFFSSREQIEEALQIAGRKAGFRIDEASPVAAAPGIRCPVILVHGDRDRDTPPAHSARVEAALRCPKELILLHGIGHHDPIDAGTWSRIHEAVAAMAAPPALLAR